MRILMFGLAAGLLTATAAPAKDTKQGVDLVGYMFGYIGVCDEFTGRLTKEDMANVLGRAVALGYDSDDPVHRQASVHEGKITTEAVLTDPRKVCSQLANIIRHKE